MALLIQNWYCTEENGKLKYAKQCIESLLDTVNFGNGHRMGIINQNSCKDAFNYLIRFKNHRYISVINLDENIGTAGGLNIGLRLRMASEFCIKLDDDLTWETDNWIEAMEAEIKNNPEIGILGLRRPDVTCEMVADGNLLWSHDIMGTCTMFNPLMLDKIGLSYQFSNYGFEDNLFSARSEAAGFKNSYMKDIKINNLDEGGTQYTEWKKQEAAIYLQEASIMIDMIKKGKLNYYYDGGL
jgi:glycosyltransferase involved in cell wall biosynthesis